VRIGVEERHGACYPALKSSTRTKSASSALSTSRIRRSEWASGFADASAILMRKSGAAALRAI
jgi:hypothetical protein